jgi:TPR repeat protein
MSQVSAAQGPTASVGVANPVEAMAVAEIAAATEDWDAAPAVWMQHARGNVRAQAEIGRCFSNGWGIARDVDLARKCLLPAAQAGDPLAQSLLGDGPPQRSIAEEWYARAAQPGDAHAQDMLSWLLIDGDHRRPDNAQALRWALQAAAQGVAAAMTHIGLLYSNALGVGRDVAVAAQWWRKAALLGDAGAERDPATALVWLIRARRLRSRFADRFYDGVRNGCTPQQRREAERRACLPIGAQEPSP